MKNNNLKLLLSGLFIILIFLIIFLINILIGTSKINITTLFIPVILLLICFFFIIIKVFNKNSKLDSISLENAPKEFENLFSSLYTNSIFKLEKIRNKVLISFLVIISTILLVVFVPLLMVKLIFLIVGIIFFIFFILGTLQFNKMYKKSLISNFILLYNSNFSYNPLGNKQIEQTKYVNANFNNHSFSNFSVTDVIEGPLNSDTYFHMCDISVKDVKKIDENNTTTKYIFEGIFAYTVSSKNINSYIRISKNKFNIFQSKDCIHMDSSEFEKYFDIYSNNEILTMRILTHDVMEMLVNFYKIYNLQFEIVIKDNYIYLTFSTGALFEPNLFSNSLDKKLFYKYYNILNFIINLSNKKKQKFIKFMIKDMKERNVKIPLNLDAPLMLRICRIFRKLEAEWMMSSTSTLSLPMR